MFILKHHRGKLQSPKLLRTPRPRTSSDGLPVLDHFGVGTPDLLETFLKGDAGLPRSIARISAEELAREFSVLCFALVQTPMWLRRHNEPIISAIKKRADSRENTYIQQHLHFLLNSDNRQVKDLIADAFYPSNHGSEYLKLEERFFSKHRHVGEHQFPRYYHVFHPFEDIQVSHVSLKERLKDSKVVVQLHCKGTQMAKHVTLQTGRDLRKDVACLHVFRLLNKLWRREAVHENGIYVEAKVYDCVAMSQTFGCIEYIPNCRSPRTVEGTKLHLPKRNRLLTTAAGAYVSAWILGIAGRNCDNTVITKDRSLFHTNFNDIFVEHNRWKKAGPFAMTKQLLDEMGNWNSFVELCVNAFKCLRSHHQIISEYASTVFCGVVSDDVKNFVRRSLVDDEDRANKTFKKDNYNNETNRLRLQILLTESSTEEGTS
eukprot:TRINITY_DN1185_c0_g1_i1.p1 TRINITY_DN1185_c0_g1~~TRINITY_DN1185_c0_g1_i1.p1  ORF type:complete len:431 (+),score=68.47 TRINITY_DN1185_c0_g1_i1:228-1520(+)